MSTPQLVRAFYQRIWNQGDLGAVPELLAEGFVFRGSLGSELSGRDAFAEYVRLVRGAISDYRCRILDCVHEGDRAFARMHFSGIHTGTFRNYPATGQPVVWAGAALFKFNAGVIAELWVLGDLAGLDAALERNAAASSGNVHRNGHDPE